MNDYLLILVAVGILGLFAYNIVEGYRTDAFKPEQSPDYVEFLELGCDDTKLERANNNTEQMICRGVGEVCELACKNSSAKQVQAAMSNDNNVVLCRCYRGN